MNLEYSNFTYFNKEHSICGKMAFNVTIKDLDNEVNNGEEFVYTFCEEYIDKPNTLDIYVMNDYLNGKFKNAVIADFSDARTLEEAKYDKTVEIKETKQYMLENECVMYNDDLFGIDESSVLKLSCYIQNYTLRIDRNLIREEDILQPWISNTETRHNLSFNQLLELYDLILNKITEIECHANDLITAHIDTADTLDDINKVNWTAI